MNESENVFFTLGGMAFEYDSRKNEINIQKHGISLRSAARVFFDYDRIEYFDEEHSEAEDRFNTIGEIGIHTPGQEFMIGSVGPDNLIFVVYTERNLLSMNGHIIDVTRLISARYATSFERGLYYGKL